MLLTLLVGMGVLLGSVLIYGIATALVLHVMVRWFRGGHAVQSFWQSVTAMTLVALATAAVHLTEIALWAVALIVCGEISTFEAAFYCSAENYTALGYGDIPLSEHGRLLGPLEAINGLLLFGLSTAAMFAVMGRLIMNRLGRRLGRLAEVP